uniref:Uncharacterized protein n=1 Tax=Rhizophora mucronata TaxID=61149 RepID=A0A2P2JAT8_RHIMU
MECFDYCPTRLFPCFN